MNPNPIAYSIGRQNIGTHNPTDAFIRTGKPKSPRSTVTSFTTRLFAVLEALGAMGKGIAIATLALFLMLITPGQSFWVAAKAFDRMAGVDSISPIALFHQVVAFFSGPAAADPAVEAVSGYHNTTTSGGSVFPLLLGLITIIAVISLKTGLKPLLTGSSADRNKRLMNYALVVMTLGLGSICAFNLYANQPNPDQLARPAEKSAPVFDGPSATQIKAQALERWVLHSTAPLIPVEILVATVLFISAGSRFKLGWNHLKTSFRPDGFQQIRQSIEGMTAQVETLEAEILSLEDQKRRQKVANRAFVDRNLGQSKLTEKEHIQASEEKEAAIEKQRLENQAIEDEAKRKEAHDQQMYALAQKREADEVERERRMSDLTERERAEKIEGDRQLRIAKQQALEKHSAVLGDVKRALTDIVQYSRPIGEVREVERQFEEANAQYEQMRHEKGIQHDGIQALSAALETLKQFPDEMTGAEPAGDEHLG